MGNYDKAKTHAREAESTLRDAELRMKIGEDRRIDALMRAQIHAQLATYYITAHDAYQAGYEKLQSYI